MSLRLFKILWVIARHRLDTLVPVERLPLWSRLLMWFMPLRLIPVGQRSRGERLRLALESLGPIFIKFGQM
ncbi:ubiquinone biosynthesis regulatory protein kinase UbiB, partial [Halomonas sp. 707D7]|nr:ubiquinone biosynthesis regulatory protein kinase UbiB [Halomonas sp. 707D7]